jgi:hypothetical protein
MKIAADISRFLEKNEKWFFRMLVFVHAVPVLVNFWMPTVDGPAHLHNSKLLFSLLGQNEFIKEFYTLNPLNIPNLTGHITLLGLQGILGPIWAEKILQLIIIMGLPLSVRYCALAYGVTNRYVLYFVFPFTYSFHFFFGFYNFLLGLILLFAGWGFWEVSKDQRVPKRLALLTLLTVALYYTHLTALALFLGGVVIFECIEFLEKKDFRRTLRNLLPLVLASLPVLIVVITYLSGHSNAATLTQRLSFSEIANVLTSVQPARGIEYGKEGIFTQWIFYSFIGLIILEIFNLIKGKRPSLQSKKWMALSAVITIALFLLPDSGSSSGMVTGRIGLILFLLLIILFSYIPSYNWFKGVYIIISIYVSLALLKIYNEAADRESQLARSIIEAAHTIPENSIILPLLSDEYWLHGHISNLLGIEKAQVILENYEAELSYFPLSWKKPFPEIDLAGETWENPFSTETSEDSPQSITHVFLLGDPDKIPSSQANLSELEVVYSDSTHSVYLYKTNY